MQCFLHVLKAMFIYMISNLYSLTFNTSHVLSAQHTFTRKKSEIKKNEKLYSFIAPAKSTPIQTQRKCIEPLLIFPTPYPLPTFFLIFSS